MVLVLVACAILAAAPVSYAHTVAFRSERDGVDTIYLTEADGTNERVWLRAKPGGSLLAPHWSPDGRLVLLNHGTFEAGLIGLVDARSRKVVRDLTPAVLRAGLGFASPAWSPDGRYIAFSGRKDRPADTSDIWLFDVRREAVVARLTGDPTYDMEPSWSPDSRRIAFSSIRNGQRDI